MSESTNAPMPAPGRDGQGAPPSPELFFRTANSYQECAALKAAVELDLFTAIEEGAQTAAEIADAVTASERGVRILCDYLCILGFLTKDTGYYGLTPDTALFLNRKSPAFVGSTLEFLLAPHMVAHVQDLASVVRRGGAPPDTEALAPEHPMWVIFARAMMPLMALPAQLIAGLVNGDSADPIKVLDIAAGHGLFGIAFAKRNPNAQIVALDWPNVLEVAREHAEADGVGDLYTLLPGSAFDVEFGTGYDLVLLPNFIHHFDRASNVRLFRKVRAALGGNGRAVTLEFIPNEDRISPPVPAMFSMMMLASTPGGDTYTYPEIESMFAEAGFSRSELHAIPPSPQRVVISYK